MWKIIAIWWGEIRVGNPKHTLEIDKRIVELSWKSSPMLLFIPTASNDSESYYDCVKSQFTNLGCKTDVLYLTKNRYSNQQLEDKILSTDIIYVGWWNTLKMMTIWRKLWVDKILYNAYQKWVVLSGLSAWSICWFNYWNSDSRKFTSWSDKLIKVTWLGFIDALHCPHYDSESFRKQDLKRMMKSTSWVAIAIDDGCALEVVDNTYKIISTKDWGDAYKVYWKKWNFYEEKLIKNIYYSDIQNLISK